MPLKSLLVIMMFVCLLTPVSKTLWAQDDSQDANWNGNDNYPFEQNLDHLRVFQEGAIFMLKRYAILEAEVRALEKGRRENQAFAIGAGSLVPGAGQIINQDYVTGGLMLFTTTLSWTTVQQLAFTKKKQQQHLDLLPYYYISLAVKNGIMTYAMLHAANQHYRMHRDKTAAMWTGMSSMLPGVGQAINGAWWEAGAFLATWSLASLVNAALEEKIFINSDDSYLVQDKPSGDWSLAFLPGGALLGYTHRW